MTAELTEQQKHLQQLFEQQNQLSNDINTLSNQIATKRELFFKVQGAIEYLQQTGVTLETTEEPEKKEEEVVEESTEKQ
jgi:septal ring factor EnvC (AmiA/AmiB activator)